MLKTLGESHPIEEGAGAGLRLAFEQAQEPGLCEVCLKGSAAIIRYSAPAQAGRALGALLGGLVKSNGIYRETTPFSMLGIMLDCSRNAVMTVDHLKIWMRRLALLGYNMVMLYTEDTYELPGEPFFGYQRGAYTKAELQAIDGYAARLNIAVIPCIQTLGHLEKILRHPAYADIKDTARVMLAGEPKTYRLIEKMVRHWKEVCRSKRIHIGMDETHDLGRGRYMDKHGYRRGFDLFNEHLAKTISICKKHGLTPMLWSDMYFRMGSPSGQSYYDPATVIPKDVAARIPKAAELVYWDYYHKDKAFYLDWIERHRKLGKEPVMGSGIWTWNKYWHDHRLTRATAGPCIAACYEAKLKEIFFTQWGDNGAYCDHDSAFAGMAWCADKAYGAQQPSPAGLEKRFAAVCGGSYRAHILAGDIHGGIGGLQPNMWEDPFFETHFRTFAKDSPWRMAELAAGFDALARKLKAHVHDRKTGDLNHACATARAFAERYALAAALLAANRRKDNNALKKARARIPAAVKGIKAMEKTFRRMWLGRNKPEGLETIQERFGMIAARYREMTVRIGEYLEGRIDSIAELDCRCPPG
jgi:hexosaminidase